MSGGFSMHRPLERDTAMTDEKKYLVRFQHPNVVDSIVHTLCEEQLDYFKWFLAGNECEDFDALAERGLVDDRRGAMIERVYCEECECDYQVTMPHCSSMDEFAGGWGLLDFFHEDLWHSVDEWREFKEEHGPEVTFEKATGFKSENERHEARLRTNHFPAS